MKSLIDSTKRHNTAFLITKFFEIYKADASQGYYEYPRHYDYFDKLANERTRTRQLVAQYMSESDRVAKAREYKASATHTNKFVEEKTNNLIREIEGLNKDEARKIARAQLARMREQYDDNEKQIRRHKVQDIIIFLMSRELLLKVGKTDRNGKYT